MYNSTMATRRPWIGGAVACVALSTVLASGTAISEEFTVDPQAAEQAIERALVQTGSVLLPYRAVEVVPSFTLERNENEVAGVPILVNGQLLGSTITLESNELSGGITVRAGLPWAGQFQISVPLTYTNSDAENRVLGTTISSESSSLSGLGDVQLSYTQQFRGNGGGLPSILGTVLYDSDTGATEEADLFLGSGFQEVGVQLTATQRQDPLVFSSSVGYMRAFEDNDVRLGDKFFFGGATFLAVNPETSLQFGLSLAYSNDAQINGESLPGSDQLAATLDLGIATILRRNTLLDTTLSIGLTEDATDFGLAVNLPVRFTF
jgi:hypothetical protein